MRAPHPPDSPRALIGDQWTLLIVRDLASGPRRLVELERVLPGISTEQLRSRLITMVAQGLLTRRRYREVPPRVDYSLTPRSPRSPSGHRGAGSPGPRLGADGSGHDGSMTIEERTA